MQERYYLSVLWSGRRESTEESARRAETFFQFVSRYDPAFSRWFEKAETLEEALQLEFQPSYDTLVHLFQEKYLFDEDGVNFGAWTGQPEDGRGSMLRLRCGSSAEMVPNSCFLALPDTGPEASRVLALPMLSAVLRALVLAWEPDFGLVTPDDLRGRLRQEEDWRQPLGWLTYLSARRGTVPPLPPPVRVESLEDKGTLVILTSERLSVGNPEHVALALGVQAVLDEQNLLAPVIPPRPPRS